MNHSHLSHSRVPEAIQGGMGGGGGESREAGIQGAGGESCAAGATNAKEAFCHVELSFPLNLNVKCSTAGNEDTQVRSEKWLNNLVLCINTQNQEFY